MTEEALGHAQPMYRTKPDQTTTGWPPGIGYIIGNEACERFSYYGMRAILYIHLVGLFTSEFQRLGVADFATTAKDWGTAVMHLFSAGVYALPMIGAIIADRWAGKYNTILYLSLVYCLGNAIMAIGHESLTGVYCGLALIAIGSGGIKPCVSANVGDQFGKGNWYRVRTVYQIFYFSINFGSFFATIFIPRLRESFGPAVAFGVPGVLMLLATVLFWLGRRRFVHVLPNPGGRLGVLDTLSSVSFFLAVGHFFFTATQAWWIMLVCTLGFLGLGIWLFKMRQENLQDDGFLAVMLYSMGHLFSSKLPVDKTSNQKALNVKDDLGLLESRFWGPAARRFGVEATEGPVAVLKIISVFFLVSIFWALFDQHSSSWIRQAAMMDLTLWGDRKALPSEIPALNPLMVMLLIPVMNVVYKFFDKVGFHTTPLRRITVGMLLASLSFVVVALIQAQIDTQGEGKVWFVWQVVPYVLITIAEVMVSITGLEFAYTQAPRRMKSIIMGFWLLTVTLGNIIVALLAGFGKLPLVDFFWVFAVAMAVAAVLFGVRAFFYQARDYHQA